MKRLSIVVLAGCTGAGSGGGNDGSELPSENPPPSWGMPIVGGTLLVTRDGARAVVSDPDRDRIDIVDLATETAIESITLDAGSWPGRVAEDGAGRIHVVLRDKGELLTRTSATDHKRRAVCAEPRSVAWDPATDLVHVTCATGELVSLPAPGGDPVRVLRIARDLRDVIVRDGGLVVTTFRTAELITLDSQGAIVSRVKPPTTRRLEGSGGVCVAPPCILVTEDDGKVDATPAVAWRTIALADGRLVMSHQRQVHNKLQLFGGGYGDPCGNGPVESAITVFEPGQPPRAVAPRVRGALPVDVAVSPSGTTLAFITAGTLTLHLVETFSLQSADDDECGGSGSPPTAENDFLGAPTSVAYTPGGDLITYYPELPALVIRTAGVPRTVRLPGDIGYDSGRATFHQQAAVGIACASCHPEGRDDGNVWEFEELGLRRTQSLAGGILERAPYHWSADMADLETLMEDVFSVRMLGGELTRSQRLSLGPWLDRIRAPRGVVVDEAAVTRGRILFNSEATECTKCHAGPLRTNNKVEDVGTGGAFKVPSLAGVGARAPFLHDGCAPTLLDRFGSCGGGDLHGKTSQLGAGELADLAAYLESM